MLLLHPDTTVETVPSISYGQCYKGSYPSSVSWAMYRVIDVRETIELAAHRLNRAEGSS